MLRRVLTWTVLIASLTALAIGVQMTIALAHPGGLHHWHQYRDHHVKAELGPAPEDPGPQLAVWLDARRELVRDLKPRWEKFDARYWTRYNARQAETTEHSASDISENGISSNVTPTYSGSVNWLAVADCESGDHDGHAPYTPNWTIDSTYDGGLQFSPSTWLNAGGGRYAQFAYQATPSQQIQIASEWAAEVGCIQCSAGWPNCGRYAYTE